MSHNTSTFSFKLGSECWEFLCALSRNDGVSFFHSDVQRNAATGTKFKWWPQLEIYLHCMSLRYGICLCNNYSTEVRLIQESRSWWDCFMSNWCQYTHHTNECWGRSQSSSDYTTLAQRTHHESLLKTVKMPQGNTVRSVTQECRSARCVWSVGFLFWYSCFWDPFLEKSLSIHHNMLGKNAHLFLSKLLNVEVTSFFSWEGD